MREYILLGDHTEREITVLLSQASLMQDTGERIAYLSGRLLDTPYNEDRLIGDKGTPEVFVIDLSGLDCLTYLEYVEAMRISRSFGEFRTNVQKVRYRDGTVSFRTRNHFLTDWSEYRAGRIDEVTETLGGDRTVTNEKVLNRKQDGSYFLEGVQPVPRSIRYLPSESVDEGICSLLKTGDYIGIYARPPGLDVSHAGILIKEAGGMKFRHASSQAHFRRVVDEDFRSYIADKPGVLVLRPK
ncbi:MAG: N-acetylmuramoyl-L-alanine amidase-like domain-containing protein [Nitrospirota bacterium]